MRQENVGAFCKQHMTGGGRARSKKRINVLEIRVVKFVVQKMW